MKQGLGTRLWVCEWGGGQGSSCVGSPAVPTVSPNPSNPNPPAGPPNSPPIGGVARPMSMSTLSPASSSPPSFPAAEAWVAVAGRDRMGEPRRRDGDCERDGEPRRRWDRLEPGLEAVRVFSLRRRSSAFSSTNACSRGTSESSSCAGVGTPWPPSFSSKCWKRYLMSSSLKPRRCARCVMPAFTSFRMLRAFMYLCSAEARAGS